MIEQSTCERSRRKMTFFTRGDIQLLAQLAALNRDFEQVLLDLERVGALGLFPDRGQRKFLPACRVTLEETRAWVNFELVEMLHEREEREWVRFARLRQRAEKTM